MKKELLKKIEKSKMTVSQYIRVKYIGVSKLCCEYCHTVLAGKNVSIGHRGTSGITFLGWLAPCLANALEKNEIDEPCKRAYENAKELKTQGKKTKEKKIGRTEKNNIQRHNLWEDLSDELLEIFHNQFNSDYISFCIAFLEFLEDSKIRTWKQEHKFQTSLKTMVYTVPSKSK